MLSITSFGLDKNSELYFTAFDGKIHKLNANVAALTISAPVQITSTPLSNEEVEISANVSSANRIREVILSYKHDSVWTDVSMTQVAEGMFSATIPAMPYQTTVEYKIIAYDNLNNSAVSDNQGIFYHYTVIGEFPTGTIIAVLIGTTLLTAAVIKRRSRS